MKSPQLDLPIGTKLVKNGPLLSKLWAHKVWDILTTCKPEARWCWKTHGPRGVVKGCEADSPSFIGHSFTDYDDTYIAKYELHENYGVPIGKNGEPVSENWFLSTFGNLVDACQEIKTSKGEGTGCACSTDACNTAFFIKCSKFMQSIIYILTMIIFLSSYFPVMCIENLNIYQIFYL